MGFGIRFIIDTYILNKKVDFDISESLAFKQGRLIKFSNSINDLSDYWFGEATTTPELDDLCDYILNSGIYGTTDNKVKNTNQSRFKYIILRIFAIGDE